MSGTAIIFGGTGYIGSRLARRLRESGFTEVILADIKPLNESLGDDIVYLKCDVRKSILEQIGSRRVDWIFNFAAIHREPGHQFREYFDTNIPGAKNVCAYADVIGCSNILFTSSIAVYGEIHQQTDETMETYPDTGYGISKLCAELIHEGWQSRGDGRRVLIVRPGVVYGPGDPGNILRLIRAIKQRVFLMPGDGSVRKSYAYIYGLLDCFEFLMNRPDACVNCNYVERDTKPLSVLVTDIKSVLEIGGPILRLPLPILVFVAKLIQFVTAGRSSIHPVRVMKASHSTHIIPGVLIKMGFEFQYEFLKSLKHWKGIEPADFSF